MVLSPDKGQLTQPEGAGVFKSLEVGDGFAIIAVEMKNSWRGSTNDLDKWAKEQASVLGIRGEAQVTIRTLQPRTSAYCIVITRFDR